MITRDEIEFTNDVHTVLESRAPRVAWILLSAVLLMLVVAIFWAHSAVLEEVTSGEGKVIPSSQIQVLQTLEGGIVRQILVREGDRVEKDQILLQIDDTGFSSRLGELNQRRWALLAEMTRLRAEANDAEKLNFGNGMPEGAESYFESENQAFIARRSRLEQELSILRQQLEQKRQELDEIIAKRKTLESVMVPLSRELELTTAMKERGVIPEIELLRLQRQNADLQGELDVVISSIPRARNAIVEAEIRFSGAKLNMQAEARERLGTAVGELAIVDESIKAALNRVERASLKSPVSGIVNQLHVTTIGAVVRSGQDLVEIVPVDDTLLIEARILPRDVAFVRPGQDASVKLTAYDYSIYGALAGKVERISADTFKEGREDTFYRVIVRTDRAYLEGPQGKLPILPGMIAQIDILTGEKTVLSYLINPINKVRHEALRER